MSDRSRFNAPNNQEAIVDKEGRPTNFMVKFFNESYRYINTIIEGVVDSVNGRTGDVTLSKDDVGLGNVDNTADQNKPVSQPQAAALDDKENKGVAQALMTEHTEATDPHPQYAFAKGTPYFWFNTGSYYNGIYSGETIGNQVIPFNRVHAYPFLINRTQSFDELAIERTNASTGSSNFRFGIYTNKSETEVYPYRKIAEIEDTIQGIASMNQYDLESQALRLEPGLYWMAIIFEDTGLSALRIVAFDDTRMSPIVMGYEVTTSNFVKQTDIIYEDPVTPAYEELPDIFWEITDPGIDVGARFGGWAFLKAIDTI